MLLIYPMVFVMGVLNRIVDMVADDGLRLNRYFTYLMGICYGLLIAFIISSTPILAELGIAILLSLLVLGKIDHPGHYFGIGSAVFALAVWGFSPVSLPLLGMFILFAFVDELGNHFADKGRITGIPGRFFRLRLTMEAVTLILSAYTGQWIYFLAMLCYDAGFTYVFPDSVRRKLISVGGQ